MPWSRLESLYDEAGELMAMFVTMVTSVKRKSDEYRKRGLIPHPSSLIPKTYG
jgi:hypothetical protein